MARIVIEQHLGDFEVADGDCSEQGRVLGPTNFQIDKPPLVVPATDYQGASPMIVVIANPCRPKPCHCAEHVDLGGTRHPWHPVRDSQDEVRVIFGVDEPLQEALPKTTLDEAVCWLGPEQLVGSKCKPSENRREVMNWKRKEKVILKSQIEIKLLLL